MCRYVNKRVRQKINFSGYPLYYVLMFILNFNYNGPSKKKKKKKKKQRYLYLATCSIWKHPDNIDQIALCVYPKTRNIFISSARMFVCVFLPNERKIIARSVTNSIYTQNSVQTSEQFTNIVWYPKILSDNNCPKFVMIAVFNCYDHRRTNTVWGFTIPDYERDLCGTPN